MSRKYFFLAMWVCACAGNVQAAVWGAVWKRGAKTEEQNPSWRDDVADHYVLWAMAPSVSSLGLVLVGMMGNSWGLIQQGEEVKAFVALVLGALMANGLLVLILTYWSGTEKEAEAQEIPWTRRCWRFVRFLLVPGLLSPLLSLVGQLGYLDMVLWGRKHDSGMGVFLLWGLYPILLCVAIALCVMGYEGKLTTKEPKK